MQLLQESVWRLLERRTQAWAQGPCAEETGTWHHSSTASFRKGPRRADRVGAQGREHFKEQGGGQRQKEDAEAGLQRSHHCEQRDRQDSVRGSSGREAPQGQPGWSREGPVGRMRHPEVQGEGRKQGRAMAFRPSWAVWRRCPRERGGEAGNSPGKPGRQLPNPHPTQLPEPQQLY